MTRRLYLPCARYASTHPVLSKIARVGTPALATGLTGTVAGFLDNIGLQGHIALQGADWVSHGSAAGVAGLLGGVMTWGALKVFSDRVKLAGQESQLIDKQREAADKQVRINDLEDQVQNLQRGLEEKAAEARAIQTELEALRKNSADTEEVITRLQRGDRAAILRRWNIQRLMINQESGRPIGYNYLFSERIGKGGMGEVRLVINLSQNNRIEVIKICLEELAGVPEFQERFFTEARVLEEKLKGIAGAIKVYGSGMWKREGEEDRPIYLMEYFPGASMMDMLEDADGLPVTLSFRESLRYMNNLAQVIAGVHDFGIVHRDLKPDNVLVSGSLLKVIDFGIAKDTQQARSLTMTSSAMGTPEYAAPEQLTDSKRVGPQADIYALGAIWHRMLVGSVPYPTVRSEASSGNVAQYLLRLTNVWEAQRRLKMSKSEFAEMAGISNETMITDALMPDVPKLIGMPEGRVAHKLREVFGKLLAPDVDQRCSSVAEFITDLNTLDALVKQRSEQAQETAPHLFASRTGARRKTGL